MRRSRFVSKAAVIDAFDKAKSAERVCAVCGADLEVDPESGELHCPVCEENAAP